MLGIFSQLECALTMALHNGLSMCKKLAALVCVIVVASCSRISSKGDGGSTDDGGEGGSEGDESSASSGDVDTDLPREVPGGECVSNVGAGDLSVGLGEDCFVDDDECVPGLKCSHWDVAAGDYAVPGICVRVRDSALGAWESCSPNTTSDPLDGADDCDRGLTCLAGFCQPYCGLGGQCADCGPMAEFCVGFPTLVWPRPLGTCVRECSPLDGAACDGVQECTELQIDVRATHADYPWSFACLPERGEAMFPEGGECNSSLNCEGGLVCIAKEAYGDGCDGGAFVRRCCSPFCELGDDSVCSGTQTCIAIFPMGHPLDTLGVCSVLENPLDSP